MSLSLAFSPQLKDTLKERDYNYVVTGVTGWIGRATLEMLALALEDRFTANVQVYGRQSTLITTGSGYHIQVRPLTAPLVTSKKPTIFFHYAFLTKDKIASTGIDKYRQTNSAIRDLVLNLAAPLNIEAVILASSGAVYNYITGKGHLADTFIYGQLKYEDEQFFADWCHKAGILLVIPRIFNISGPFINKFRSYALSVIISDVFSGRVVHLTSDCPVYRSYVYVGDVIEVSLRQIFTDRKDGLLVYDTRGSEVVEIGQLAREVCNILGCFEFEIERPALVVDREDRYLGNPYPWMDIIDKERYSMLPLRDQIISTAQYMRGIYNVKR